MPNLTEGEAVDGVPADFQPLGEPCQSTALTQGAYTNRIVAAVRAGRQSTSDIVAATRIPRESAVKTISYLILTRRLFDAPVPPDAREGDRYVTLTSPAPDVNVERVDGASESTNAREDAHAPAATEINASPAGAADAGRHATFPEASTYENRDADDMPDTLALRRIAEEWRAVSAEAENLKLQASTLRTRLETLMETLPDFHAAQASIEQALQYREVLSRMAQDPARGG